MQSVGILRLRLGGLQSNPGGEGILECLYFLGLRYLT